MINVPSFKILATLVVALFALPALANEKVSLRLGWDHQFSSAGFYAAQWQGYYADAGLEVEIKPGFTPDRKRHRSEVDILQGLSDFGIATPSVLMTHGKSASLTIFAPLYQRSPVTLYALKGTGLVSPGDLTRLRVGYLPGGSSDAEMRSMLLAEGIDPGAVKFIANKVPRLRPLVEGSLDVVASYSTSLPWLARKKGVSLEILRPSAYGIEFYGLSLITSRRLAEQKPELVQRFKDASLKGWKYALAHPEEIVQRIARDLPRVLPEEDLVGYNRFLAQEVRKLMVYPIIPIGHINLDRIWSTHAKLRSLGLVKGELDLTRLIFDPHRDRDNRNQIIIRTISFGLLGIFVLLALFTVWNASLRRKVKMTTRTLRESEDRYALAIAGTNDGIWERNLLTGEAYRSPRWHEILGYEQGNLDSSFEAVEKLIHPDDRDQHKSAMQTHLETGVPFDLEIQMQHKSGKYIWVSVKGQAAWDEDGKPLRMAGSINNITKRKCAEQALRESEERFRDIAEMASDWFWEMGPDLHFTFFSERYEEITGFRPEERIGTKREDFTPTFETRDNARKWAVHLQDLQARRPFRRFEYVSTATGDGYRHISVSGKPLFDSDGNFLGYRGTGSDISERKQAGEALRDSDKRFRSIFESGTVGKIVINESGIIEDFSSAAEGIFGYQSGELLGQNISMLMPEPDRDKHDGYLDCYLKKGEAKIIGIGREVTGLRKNGEKFQMHLGIGEFVLKGRRAFVGSVTDLTNFKALEEQLRQAQKMEVVGQLTGGLAHDFNNLLYASRINAELLELELAGRDDLLAMVRSILKALGHGAELTHRLLAFSRKQTLQPESIQLGPLCEGMNDLLKHSLGETIEIEIVDDDEPWNVQADPSQVENALLNLAINASHAMPGGGKLTVRIENTTVASEEWVKRWEGQPGEYVALRVTDTGTGMPAHVIEHVFEPFFTTKDVGQGSGLGLSMVYGFAQQSDGFVAIESIEGKGTMVTIYLPRAQPDQTITDAKETGAELQKGRGEIILLVEDEALVRDAITKLLETLGYTVLAAEDGATALEIASSGERINLVLSDMVLPGGMNGIETCNRIRELRPGLKCVFMTGYSIKSDDVLPEGTEILTKPLSIRDLAAKSRQLLDA